MRVAVTVAGEPVPACATAPDEAVCPACGGKVIKRFRKRMDGTIAYFWRHEDNSKRNCRARPRAHG